MASGRFCDPCTEANLSVSATKYCSDCEERLCPTCIESHSRFRAFKSHHVIDLSSVSSNIPESTKNICEVHPDMLLDYFCTDHDIFCCRACIPKDHRKCENVLPLEHASKDVKNSALFTDIMADIKYLIKTLNDLHDNRESIIQSLLKTKSVITKQILAVKSRFLIQIGVLEQALYDELSSLNRKHEIEEKKQKGKISQVLGRLKASENEIGFLKDYGCDKQLFISLHQQVKHIRSAEASVLQMISNSKEIEITFEEKKDIKIDFFGQLSETVKPCEIQYISKKFQQAQIMTEQVKHILKFEKDTELKLTHVTAGLNCFNDLAITVDNKLLLTNWSSLDPKLYVYKDCKDYEAEMLFSSSPIGVVVIPGADRAIVTLPAKESIQFINTTNMTKINKVKVGFKCFGITASRERIYVGGQGGTIKTIDTNGTILKSIKQGYDDIYFMAYDNIHEQFFVRCSQKLLCINLDGTLFYCKHVSGMASVIHDKQHNVYFSGFHNNTIQRMSLDGENCVEMLNQDNGIHHPSGMCFNNDFTKLFVINNNTRSVFVYNCRF